MLRVRTIAKVVLLLPVAHLLIDSFIVEYWQNDKVAALVYTHLKYYLSDDHAPEILPPYQFYTSIF
jgi:hypothetical protein